MEDALIVWATEGGLTPHRTSDTVVLTTREETIMQYLDFIQHVTSCVICQEYANHVAHCTTCEEGQPCEDAPTSSHDA